jgi:hypothetical protein
MAMSSPRYLLRSSRSAPAAETAGHHCQLRIARSFVLDAAGLLDVLVLIGVCRKTRRDVSEYLLPLPVAHGVTLSLDEHQPDVGTPPHGGGGRPAADESRSRPVGVVE